MRKHFAFILFVFLAQRAAACDWVIIHLNGCPIAGNDLEFRIQSETLHAGRIPNTNDFEVNVKQTMSADEFTPVTLAFDGWFLCCSEQPKTGSKANTNDCEVSYTFACEKSPPSSLHATSPDKSIVLSVRAFHPDRYGAFCYATKAGPDGIENVGNADRITVIVSQTDGKDIVELVTVPVSLSSFKNGRLRLDHTVLADYLNKARKDGQATSHPNEKAALEMKLPGEIDVVMK